MGRITEYNKIDGFTGSEEFIVDGPEGTHKVTYGQLVSLIREVLNQTIDGDISGTVEDMFASGEISLDDLGIDLQDAESVYYYMAYEEYGVEDYTATLEYTAEEHLAISGDVSEITYEYTDDFGEVVTMAESYSGDYMYHKHLEQFGYDCKATITLASEDGFEVFAVSNVKEQLDILRGEGSGIGALLDEINGEEI